MQGIVKWFNNQKGWGFIVPEDGQEDIFVHYSEIKGDGFKTLKAGQRVSYELEHGNKGLYARDVNALNEALNEALLSQQVAELQVAEASGMELN